MIETVYIDSLEEFHGCMVDEEEFIECLGKAFGKELDKIAPEIKRESFTRFDILDLD